MENGTVPSAAAQTEIGPTEKPSDIPAKTPAPTAEPVGDTPDAALKEIREGRHEAENGYSADFETYFTDLPCAVVHLQNSVYDEETLMKIAELVATDTAQMEERTSEPPAKVTVYVVKHLLKDRPVAVNDSVFCTEKDLESGAYREALCGACYGQTIPWKRIGLTEYVFGTADESWLKAYYSDETHTLTASCAEVYLLDGFADDETAAAAKKTAASLTGFLIENEGFEAFRKADVTSDALSAWAERLGIEPPLLPEGHEQADLMTAETDRKYLCVVHAGNLTVYAEPGCFAQTPDEMYRFVCFFFAGSRVFADHLESVIPQTAEPAKERLYDPLSVILLPTTQYANFGNEDGIYLVTKDVIWHELVHYVLWVPQEDPEVWWEREAVADYLSAPVAMIMTPTDEEAYFSAFLQEAGEYGIDLDAMQPFIDRWTAVYRTVKERDDVCGDGRIDDHALEYALGISYMLSPDQERYHPTVGATSMLYIKTFFGNVNAIEIGTPDTDSKGLTYSEATVLFEYLVDTYGMETVMDGFLNGRTPEESFGKHYPELYGDCLAYIRETYGDLL